GQAHRADKTSARPRISLCLCVSVVHCVGHNMAPETQNKTKTFKSLPAGVWALGFVSMFMDTSSELVHSLLPSFMATTLGASMFTIGIVEGVAEATAAITRYFPAHSAITGGSERVL